MRDVMLTTHFIGLAMGLGTSFAFMFLGIASSKLEKAEAGKFMKTAMSISTMGHIGLGLLLISGGYLVGDYWDFLKNDTDFIIKLSLVGVLIILIIYSTMMAKKAKNAENPGEIMAKIKPIGQLNMLVAIAIVVMAVRVFN